MEIGDVIDDKYKIVRLLGEGGMGAVYEGENTRIHRRVAIKILHSAVASNEDAVQRFEREAQAAGRIGSEHIVEVLDLGHLENGDRYMVMEFLEGESLSERIQQRGALSPQSAAHIGLEILEGLRAAHEAGIIHRDMKPDNVFLLSQKGGRRDFVKIVDFGISKFNSLGGEFSMTRTGAVMGTPYYMSPEQAKGNRAVDHRADLYAVGVVLYECIAGKVPFQAETFNELLFKIVLEEPPPLKEKVPDLDHGFAGLITKSMHRDPDVRFQTAAEFQEALRTWLAGQPLAHDMTIAAGTPSMLAQTALGASAAAGGGTSGLGSMSGLSSTSGTTPFPETNPSTTQAAWAQTGGVPPTRSNGPLIGLVLAAVVLLGAGGFFLLSKNQNEETTLAAQAAEDAQRRATEDAERDKEIARLATEQAKAQAAAETARAQAELAKAEAEKVKLEAKERAAQEAKEREAEERAQRARTSSSRSSARSTKDTSAPAQPTTAPAASAQPAPAAPATTSSSSGRKIRTEL